MAVLKMFMLKLMTLPSGAASRSRSSTGAWP
jgi:hypothetical protein